LDRFMLHLAKLDHAGLTRLAVVEESGYRVLTSTPACRNLTDLLHTDSPEEMARALSHKQPVLPRTEARLLAPVDDQEVWAAGVTYKRSQVARMEESETGASHYDRVYTAPRPELFFKATSHRVVGPDAPIRIRTDTKWSVPEPELTLVVTSDGRHVGYTVGNDMSARDIEGENPLYLPQAKVYNQCCGLGPWLLLTSEPLDRVKTSISLVIRRGGQDVFCGETNVDQMARSLSELIDWLFKENSFPTGVYLLTGTGVVPPNDFTLAPGDDVAINIAGIGTLRNPVVQG
jgi:2-dehydro-3-deoxy-D-arabinonate dehydratase